METHQATERAPGLIIDGKDPTDPLCGEKENTFFCERGRSIECEAHSNSIPCCSEPNRKEGGGERGP